MPRHRRSVTPAAVLLIAAMAVAGCGGQGAAPGADAVPGAVIPPGAAADGLVVTFGTEPNPPEKGDNGILVTVRRSDGSPVTAGTVTAVFSMPAMPSMNMPAMRSDTALRHEGEGRYRGSGQLSMAGTWNVAVAVAVEAQPIATRHTSIVAKE
jgi:Cu(I)/Ag(I) efflux system membrane fusion protein/cobalt-zinc-cadmium efflux system membrane fusion protein